MAFRARQIFPNDLRPRVAIGFELPLNGEAVFIPNYQTKDALKKGDFITINQKGDIIPLKDGNVSQVLGIVLEDSESVFYETSILLR